MIAVVEKTTWCDVLLDLAHGRTVDGYRLLALPGFEAKRDVSIDGKYDFTDQQGLEVLLTASRLVAESVTGGDWVNAALELQERLCEPIVKHEPLPAWLRWVAWELGAAADFAVGIREAG